MGSIDFETLYAMANTHSWEAGMMVANVEDLIAGEYADRIAAGGIECAKCEDIYPPTRPCPNAHPVTLETWGFEVTG